MYGIWLKLLKYTVRWPRCHYPFIFLLKLLAHVLPILIRENQVHVEPAEYAMEGGGLRHIQLELRNGDGLALSFLLLPSPFCPFLPFPP